MLGRAQEQECEVPDHSTFAVREPKARSKDQSIKLQGSPTVTLLPTVRLHHLKVPRPSKNSSSHWD